MKTIILDRELIEGILDYMNKEKVEALEFDENNFITQIKAYNERVFGKIDDDASIH